MQFSQEELKNLSVLLQRVNLTGKEALAVAQLQVKIQNLIKQEESNVKVTSEPSGTDKVETGEVTASEEVA